MSLSIADFGTVLVAIFTAIYTVGTFMLWYSTRNTTRLLSQELKNQVSGSLSVAHHAVLDAHRDLYLEIIRDPSLLKILANNMGMTEDEVRSKYLATLLINHACRIFWDHKEHLADYGLEGFRMDAADLFSLPFVRERWEEVKKYHAPEFQIFINDKVLQ